MVDTNLPFDSDRFVRDLPELLCGRDPILERPLARRWMQESPEGRRAVHQIMGAIGVLEDTPTRVLRTPKLDNRSARSVELATKHFARRLASSLRDLFDHDMIAGSIDSPNVVVPVDRHSDTAPETREAIVHRIEATANGRTSNVIQATRQSVVVSMKDAIGQSDPRRLLTTIRRIHALPNDDYSIELLAHRQNGSDRTPQLKLLARQTPNLDVAARAATLSSAIYGDSGRYEEAVDAALFGVRFSTELSAVAYNGLLYALLARRMAEANRFFDSLQRALSYSARTASLLTAQFLTDAKQWRMAATENPGMLRSVMTVLGRAI